MDLNLLQRQVAVQIEVDEATVNHWECGVTSPNLRAMPGVIEFLGYDPWPEGQTVGQKLRRHRQGLGLSWAEAARLMGVDPATVTKWELQTDERFDHRSIPAVVRFLGIIPLPVPRSPAEYVRLSRYVAGLNRPRLSKCIRRPVQTIRDWELGRLLPTQSDLHHIEALVLQAATPCRFGCPDEILGQCPPEAPPHTLKLRTAAPSQVETLGDHIRKRRVELGWSQRALANKLRVSINTVCTWERGRKSPDLPYVPRLIEFLGYNPLCTGESPGERLRSFRTALGMTQEELAQILDVRQETISHWETAISLPTGAYLQRVEGLLNRRPRDPYRRF